MLVIDSSAIIAIMLNEPDAEALALRLAAAPNDQRLMASSSYVEAGTVLAGRRQLNGLDPIGAGADLDSFLARVSISVVGIDAAQARIALDARIRFGKGFGARAGLNFGDRIAYALAKSLNAPLLYVGADFAATDVTPAL